ncbi:MAG: hypothetical protein ACE5JL_09645 [Dehalococcoidia bacterium]
MPHENGRRCKMRYLGVAKRKGSVLEMPSEFDGAETYEVVEQEGRIVLVPVSSEPMNTEEIERLARETIDAHRKSLEALAQ